jgi:hypothetical protein
MSPPFSAEQFFGAFEAYNTAVWPAQIVLVLLALALTAVAFGRNHQGKLITIVLAALWVWMGVAYHWAFFSKINPAARVFGALFVVEGAILLWIGVRGDALAFRFRTDVAGTVGTLLIVYALLVYPVLGVLAGHRYPAQPTFGLPCPTTIFTVGLFLWARERVPWYALVIPALWSFVGMSAVRYFGMLEDMALPLAGVGGGLLVLLKNRSLQGEAGTVG